jgi:Serine phosphatase RsbU, regulator of sigma subunit
MNILRSSKIPKNYLGAFILKQTALIKGRTKLFCLLTVLIFVSAGLLAYITTPTEFKTAELPVWAIVLIGSLAVFYIAGKARSLKTAKLNAYLFTVVLLISLTYLCVLYSEYINITPALYLFLLFMVVFTIPWEPLEIVSLSFMHIAAYSALFYYIRSRYTLSDLPAVLETARYIDGLTLIAMGFVLCLVVRKKEAALDAENFVLLKKLEEKNAQMRQELELATRIHKTLIPHSVSTDMVDVAVMYLPMYYIGGDYAKFRFIDKDRFLFIICDVTGHGVSAALLVNRLHTEFERLARDGKEPGALLKELNDFITEDFGEINMFLSAFCGLLDFKTMKLLYSNHGHPDQYIYRITGSDIQRLSSQACLLGLPISDQNIYQHAVSFSKGDKILLFTDGVLDARNKAGESYGETRLEDFIKHQRELEPTRFNQILLDELNSFKDQQFTDDVFILSIHVK